jgi:hypothetical protein
VGGADRFGLRRAAPAQETAKIAIEPTASISDCQFWKDRFQKSASPR